ncbi:MAG: ThiF family adenylyltransferase [Armatimonadota bacterium]
MTTPSHLERYARQTVLPAIGREGQERLLAARVAVIGCGATGTVIANHLARAGVGYLRIVDRDWVELNNLQRQLLYDEDDVRAARPKAAAAEAHLRRVNSSIQVEGVVQDVNASTVEELIDNCDLVMDGTDNFETRYVVNDACVELGKPWVYCGAVSTYGMTLLVRPGDSPCLRCLFPEPPPAGSAATCDTAGVLGPAVSVVASHAATEALKWLVGAHDALAEGLLHVDVWDLSWRLFEVQRKDDCPCCARGEFPFLQVDAVSHATALCGRGAVQITPARRVKLDLEALGARLRPVGPTTVTPHLLKLEVEPFEITVFPDGRAVIEGTAEEAEARSLYARYVGT